VDVEAAAAEVVRHHVCIERWLSGADPASDSVFAALADAHLPEFALVGPDGVPRDRADVLGMLRAAHGAVPGLRITIADVRAVAAAPDHIVIAYRELHQAPGPADPPRASTAVLRRAAPLGLRWQHLQETWSAPAPPGR
jgi:hypothetical protein